MKEAKSKRARNKRKSTRKAAQALGRLGGRPRKSIAEILLAGGYRGRRLLTRLGIKVPQADKDPMALEWDAYFERYGPWPWEEGYDDPR